MQDTKIIDRIIKVRATGLSEISIGNIGAGQLYLEKVKQDLIKYGLAESDLDSRFKLTNEDKTVQIVNNLGKTILQNPFLRVNVKTYIHMQWYDDLAQVIASHYGCITESRGKSGEVSFYGYDFDREMSSYLFQKISRMAFKAAKIEEKRLKPLVGAINPLKQNKVYLAQWPGDNEFEYSFHAGFRNAVKEIYAKNEREISNEVKQYHAANSGDDFQLSIRRVDYPIIEMILKLGRGYGRSALLKDSSNPNNSASEAITKDIRESSGYDLDTRLLLIDVSGSMAGKSIRQAKTGALDYATGSVNKNCNIGVITFESEVNYLIKATHEVNGKFTKAIDSLRALGSTNLSAALRLALCYFPNSRVKRTICVVTDGMPDNPEEALQIAITAKQLGIKIIAIGTGNAKQDFLDKLCSEDGLAVLVSGQRLALTMGEMANR